MAGRPSKAPPRTELEYLLWQRDQTYDEVVAEFVRLARSLGEHATLTSRHLRRLASGERDGVTPVTSRVLQAMFGRPADNLLAPFGQSGDLTPLLRGLVMRPAVTTIEEMLTLAADRARKFALLAGQGELADETLDQIYDDVRQLVGAYPQRPLAGILADLVTAQDTVFTLLETRRRPTHARQLYLLGGVVGGLLAKASHDMADPQAALTQSRTAYLCAEQADHDGLRAWIRGLQALITYWDNRLRESVRYAQQGAQFAERSGSTAAVWLPVSEARAWAALGNVPETRHAIDRAETAWEVVRSDELDELDELSGICTFSRARQLYYAADALAWLPAEARQAQDYAAQAVTAYADHNSPEWAFGDEAGSRCDLAVARIAVGEIDGAREAVAAVLQLPAEQRIRGIISSVQHVHSALRQADVPPAGRELQEEIEVFAKTPLRALPS
jgi:hypothetical protein